MRSEKEIYLRDHQSNQQRIQEAQQKEKKLKQDLEELKLLQINCQKTLGDIRGKQKKIEEDFKLAEGHVTEQSEALKLKENELLQLRNELQIKQRNHLKLLEEEGRLSGQYKESETRLEGCLDRKKLSEERKEKLVGDQKQLLLLSQEKKQQLSHVSSVVDSYKDRLDQYEEELKDLTKEGENKQKEFDISQKKILEQKARQKVLVRLREDFEGFSLGSKKLLQASNHPQCLFYNKIRPLYEFVNAEMGSAESTAAILRHYSQTLVVEKQEILIHILQFAQKHAIFDYSLICLELLSEWSKISGVQGPDSADLIQYFLKDAREVSSYEEAFSLIGKTISGEIWCGQGFLFDHRSVIFNVKANENQVFLREAELKTLDEELVKNEDYQKKIVKEQSVILQLKSKMQLERSELDKMLRRDEMKLVEVNFGLQRCLADQEKNKIEVMQIEKEDSNLASQITQQGISLKEIQEKRMLNTEAITTIHQQTECLANELSAQSNVFDLQQKERKEKAEIYQHIADDRQKLLHQLNVLEMQGREYLKQEQRFIDELEYLEEIQSKIKNQSPQLKNTIEQLEERLKENTCVCADLEQQIEDHKLSIVQYEKEMLLRQEQSRKCESELHAQGVQAAQHQSAAHALENELQDRYQLSVNDARDNVKASQLPEKSNDTIEKQIRVLRQFLQQAGDINMASIDDLEKQESRYSFLTQQVEDMSVSKEELTEIITQVDEESRKLFKLTFETIRENFKKNFQILFNGGEADLQLTETKNILEAGVEIIAKPPGKQMRSISLLSGGEKCLTAVALLFSIFEVKPAPFCILDEIDAPLDDTNVDRFANVVKHFTDRCQFLIITHNKRTMSIGNVLFGVSMEEKGVSKLLSLEFIHEEAPTAELIEK